MGQEGLIATNKELTQWRRVKGANMRVFNIKPLIYSHYRRLSSILRLAANKTVTCVSYFKARAEKQHKKCSFLFSSVFKRVLK